MPRGPSIERERRLGEIRQWILANPAGIDYRSIVGRISSDFTCGPRVAKEYLEDLQNRGEILIRFGRVMAK